MHSSQFPALPPQKQNTINGERTVIVELPNNIVNDRDKS